MIMEESKRQFSPLSLDIKAIRVVGVEKKFSPPFCLMKINNESKWVAPVYEVFSMHNGKPVDKSIAEFQDYEDACSVAISLLKDLKMTIEEDKFKAKNFPEKVFRLDNV